MLAISLAGSLVVPATALALPPVNLTPPTISGNAQEGQQLTCSDGTWLFSPTSYAYQWSRDAGAIGGATSSTYTVQSGDVGHLITCSVVASNADGPSLLAATSLPVIPTASPPVNVLPPLITGVPEEGEEVACSDGAWLFSPADYDRRWLRDGSPIGGATSSTYTLQAADVGAAITCGVTASNAAGPSTEATSLPIVPLPAAGGAPPVNLLPPVIGGTAQQGSDVTCSDGTWLNSPTSYAKQWNRDGTAIPGETADSYTIVAADVGHLLTCSVVASNADGPNLLPATSLPVTPLPAALLNTAKPQISGTAQEGRQLTCSNGSWLPEPDSFAHAWERDGSPILGAANSTYAVQAEDVGTALTCTVTATNLAGSVDATSDPVMPTADGGGGGGTTPPPSSGSSTPEQPGPGAASDATAPVVSGFALTRRRFAVGRATTPVVAKAKAGTAFRFALSEAAYVEFVISRTRRGYRAGGRCVAKPPRTGSSRPGRCRLERRAGRLVRAGAAGPNRVDFSGRVGRRALKPGGYVATIRAGDAAGNVSTPRRIRFQVLSGRSRPPR